MGARLLPGVASRVLIEYPAVDRMLAESSIAQLSTRGSQRPLAGLVPSFAAAVLGRERTSQLHADLIINIKVKTP